jgi:hypothetical protein
VRRVSVPVFFNILWLGNVGNWRFNLFGLRRTGEAWPRSTEGGGVWKIKSLTFQSKNQKKKRENSRIQRDNYSLKSNNQGKKFNRKIIDKTRDCPNLPWAPLLTRAIR